MPVINKKRKIDLNVRPDILCTELALRGKGRQQLNSEQMALKYLSDQEYRKEIINAMRMPNIMMQINQVVECLVKNNKTL